MSKTKPHPRYLRVRLILYCLVLLYCIKLIYVVVCVGFTLVGDGDIFARLESVLSDFCNAVRDANSL